MSVKPTRHTDLRIGQIIDTPYSEWDIFVILKHNKVATIITQFLDI